MTGHGQARFHDQNVQITVEVRTVNNRFLKLNVYSDLDASLQSKLEAIVRDRIHRGTVTLRVSVESLSGGEFELNESVIRGYWLQLSEIAGSSQSVNVESLLALPGVVTEKTVAKPDELWPQVESTVREAIKNLEAMRAQEGEAMQQDMLSNIDSIAERLKTVEALAPRVSEAYSKRLSDRINKLLEKYDVEIAPTDIVREVGVFAERVDIAEETVRLTTHLDHFRKTVSSSEQSGRKLDFLVQEILRETNTIGSKANDSDIAGEVVEIKTCIERIREMVQNIE
jgi:uncharacterized protein (TIGR00255 family)